jgi:DNA-binding transcriptional MerR regulator
MPRQIAELTIGAVAHDTGVSVAGLRAWEVRYGLPAPTRLPGAHRRYSLADVEQIREVLADRDAGLSLESAIIRLRSHLDRVEPSLFAGLRRRFDACSGL